MANQRKNIGLFSMLTPLASPARIADDSAPQVKRTRQRNTLLSGTEIYMLPKIVSPYYDLVNINGIKVDKNSFYTPINSSVKMTGWNTALLFSSRNGPTATTSSHNMSQWRILRRWWEHDLIQEWRFGSMQCVPGMVCHVPFNTAIR
ncbi:hypothetical protein N7504_002673 [Penicillium tannophilum]|nr:hypothetical protein N7504_002673 [Penicillium tannophilum]